MQLLKVSVTLDSKRRHRLPFPIVPIYTNRYKAVKRTTSKPVLGRKLRNSVTPVTLNVDDLRNTLKSSQQVTRSISDSPKKCYLRLEPWLRLANIARPLAEQELRGAIDLRQLSEDFVAALEPASLRETPSFPGRRLQALLNNRPAVQPPGRKTEGGKVRNEESSGAVALAFYGLATAVLKMLSRVIGVPESLKPGILLENQRGSLMSQFVILKDKDSRVRVSVFDPYKDFFLRALEGSEVSRHRECEICKNYFYAVRLNQRACSKRCNSVRRVRNWRGKQATYEQNRKFRSAGVHPEGKGKS
jgi:hypothetical protein